MLKNYLLVAVRNIIRNKLHSFIKIAGLALGISSCLVVYLIVSFQLSFNTNIPDGDRIYRVCSRFSGSFDWFISGVTNAIPSAIADEFTGLDGVTHFYNLNTYVRVTGSTTKKFEDQDRIIITGPEYFDIFKMHQWVAGSPKVLNQPFTVVLTEQKARLYFGQGEPSEFIGRELIYEDSVAVSVAGIIRDIETNTDFDFSDYISYSTILKSSLKKSFDPNRWTGFSSSSQCFLKLSTNISPEAMDRNLALLGKRFLEHQESEESKAAFELQPLSDLHFNTELGTFDSGRDAAHRPTLQILMAVAALLLIIAAINFINLETARAIHRSKEVGLRKVMGSSRLNLVLHFLSDSFLLTTCAIVLSIPLSFGALQYFHEFIPAGVALKLSDPFNIGFLVITLLVVSLLAGLYPAFILSSFQPIQALRNQNPGRGSKTALLRQGLTVFQFSISQILIITTIMIAWQIRYMLDKDLGFSKDAIVLVQTPWRDSQSKAPLLNHELEIIPGIKSICKQSAPPSMSGWSTTTIKYKSAHGESIVDAHVRYADTTYMKFYDLKLLAGRNINPGDSPVEILINDAFRKKLGFETPDQAIGTMLDRNKKDDYTITGVVSDFHIQSLHHAIKPMLIYHHKDSKHFGIKLAQTTGVGFSNTLAQIETAWKKIYPNEKFEFSFLDETIERLYNTEKRTMKLASLATAMAIFVSCLGLYGLAAFSTVQRTREIGIRKVLGASVKSIIGMLSKQFLVLVFVAFLLASPIAYFTSEYWLREFAFRVSLNAFVLMVTFALAITVTILTIGYLALKAAVANPVDSLRYE